MRKKSRINAILRTVNVKKAKFIKIKKNHSFPYLVWCQKPVFKGGKFPKITPNPSSCKLFAILGTGNSSKKKKSFFIDFSTLKPIVQLGTALMPQKNHQNFRFFPILRIRFWKSEFFFGFFFLKYAYLTHCFSKKNAHFQHITFEKMSFFSHPKSNPGLSYP